jgi:hypothetical protein
MIGVNRRGRMIWSCERLLPGVQVWLFLVEFGLGFFRFAPPDWPEH